MNDAPQPGDTGPGPMKRFVRLTRKRDDGFVEFDFAIGDPEIFVELIMPPAAYEEFCRQQDVVHLDANASGSGIGFGAATAAAAAAGAGVGAERDAGADAPAEPMAAPGAREPQVGDWRHARLSSVR